MLLCPLDPSPALAPRLFFKDQGQGHAGRSNRTGTNRHSVFQWPVWASLQGGGRGGRQSHRPSLNSHSLQRLTTQPPLYPRLLWGWGPGAYGVCDWCGCGQNTIIIGNYKMKNKLFYCHPHRRTASLRQVPIPRNKRSKIICDYYFHFTNSQWPTSPLHRLLCLKRSR